MGDNISGFDSNETTGKIVSDGILFNAAGEKIGTVIGVKNDGENWIFYDKYGNLFSPNFTGDVTTSDYIEWEVASVQMPAENTDPTIQCYTRDVVLDEPTNLPNVSGGKGYIDLRTYTSAQFKNEGNVGSADTGFHSIIVRDTDGVPAIDGEFIESKPSTITVSESAATGALLVWEGLFYIPVRYPDTAAGKYVVNAKLVNTYTNTTYADFEEIHIASNGGMYTLDRSDLEVVLSGSISGKRELYTFDPSQKGQHVRFAYAHGDKGNGSQTQVQMELEFEDGSFQTIAITNFLHTVGSTTANVTLEQEKIQLDTTTGVWSKDGTEYPSGEIKAGARNMLNIPCGRQPITANVWVSGSTLSFSSMFGGNSDISNFEYSIDRGRTWQKSSSFDLSSLGSREVLPMVRDSDGQQSTLIGVSSWFDVHAGSWSADLITPVNNDTYFDDGTGDRGFNIVYSQPLGSNNLEENDRELTWTFDGSDHGQATASYGYIGYQASTPSGLLKADLDPILPYAELGQKYTVSEDIYNYYTGNPSESIDFQARIVDKVTGTVLGSFDITWAGNTTISLQDQKFEFVGAGNPVRIEIEVMQDPVIADWWSTQLSNVTTTATSVVKDSSAGWYPAVRSGKGRKPSQAGGVSFEFKAVGSGNAGMHGLDHDYPMSQNSYAGDFMFYRSSNTSVSIYENGSNKGSTGVLSNPNTVFKITIDGNGLVKYFQDGTLVYTSTTTADVDEQYFIHSSPYGKNTGIDSIVTNMVDPVVKTDNSSQYVRIDNLQVFKGLFSDSSHYAKIVSNDIFFRNINGVATAYFDPHTYDSDVTIRPKFNLIRYGNWTNDQKIKLSYRIAGGSWVEMLHHEGNFDVANELYLSPFTYGKNVDVSANNSIEYKVEVYGNGVGNTGVYLREVSDVVVY